MGIPLRGAAKLGAGVRGLRQTCGSGCFPLLVLLAARQNHAPALCTEQGFEPGAAGLVPALRESITPANGGQERRIHGDHFHPAPRAAIAAFICSTLTGACGMRSMPFRDCTSRVAATIKYCPDSSSTNSTRLPGFRPLAARTAAGIVICPLEFMVAYVTAGLKTMKFPYLAVTRKRVKRTAMPP
jgi:hypothetical protein